MKITPEMMTPKRWQGLVEAFAKEDSTDDQTVFDAIRIALVEGPCIVKEHDGPLILMGKDFLDSWETYTKERNNGVGHQTF